MGDLVRTTPYSEVTSTLEVLDCLGVSRTDLKLIRADKDLARRVADVIRTHYKITVDYRYTLAQMMLDGHYDWVDSGINSDNFPIRKKKVVVELEVQLIPFVAEANIDNNKVELNWLYRHNLRPATLVELMAFGKEYPERQNDIVRALGSIPTIDGIDYYVSLRNHHLDLFWFHDFHCGSTGGVHYVLAIRKKIMDIGLWRYLPFGS